MAETVLVFGASGRIGVSVIMAARRRGLHVLAVVRSQAAARKMYEHVGGSKEGIFVVEADPTKEEDVQGVVDQVKDGKLPAFQHVYVAGTSSCRSTSRGKALGGIELMLMIWNRGSRYLGWHASHRADHGGLPQDAGHRGRVHFLCAVPDLSLVPTPSIRCRCRANDSVQSPTAPRSPTSARTATPTPLGPSSPAAQPTTAWRA
jgi:hypothetical protein